MKVFIDVGHGGGDAGATNKELIEKQMNLRTATAVSNMLQRYGVTTKLSRTGDVNPSLTQRAKLANDWGADYFISCHYNAGGGDRGEVIHGVAYGKGVLLARAIAEQLLTLGQTTMKEYSKPASSGKGDYYTVIAATNMPAVIVEPCFIDNVADRQFADTEEEQVAIGAAIAKGVLNFLGIKYEEVIEMSKFTDVKGHYAEKHIEKLENYGIVNGVDSDGDGAGDLFKPDEPITRAQAAIMIANALTVCGK